MTEPRSGRKLSLQPRARHRDSKGATATGDASDCSTLCAQHALALSALNAKLERIALQVRNVYALFGEVAPSAVHGVECESDAEGCQCEANARLLASLSAPVAEVEAQMQSAVESAHAHHSKELRGDIRVVDALLVELEEEKRASLALDSDVELGAEAHGGQGKTERDEGSDDGSDEVLFTHSHATTPDSATADDATMMSFMDDGGGKGKAAAPPPTSRDPPGGRGRRSTDLLKDIRSMRLGGGKGMKAGPTPPDRRASIRPGSMTSVPGVASEAAPPAVPRKKRAPPTPAAASGPNIPARTSSEVKVKKRAGSGNPENELNDRYRYSRSRWHCVKW